MSYVEVAVNSGLPQRQTFSYAVPEGLSLVAGDAVLVPFGRRYLQGIVMATVDVPAFSDPKPVDARLGDRPVIAPERIELASWIADYYLSPLFPAVALMLPPGFEQRPLTYYESLVTREELPAELLPLDGRQLLVEASSPHSRPLPQGDGARTPSGRAPGLRLPPRQQAVLAYLVEHGRVEARQLEREVDAPGTAAALSQLVQRGLVQRSYGLDRPSVRAKTTRYVQLVASNDEALAAAESFAASRQARAAKVLRLLIEARGALPASELRQRTGATLPSLLPLVEAGLVDVRLEAVERDPLAGRRYERREGPPLTREQSRAFERVAAVLDARFGGAAEGNALRQAQDDRRGAVPANGANSPSEGRLALREPEGGRNEEAGAPIVDATDGRFLLHGVTGSGKTEVYLRALERTVALGRRGIVLVPEIALTPQTVRRFAERFPGQVAVLHSGLSQGELFDQWHGIRDGRYAVVIGSRSAVFAPVPDLGLIVIDEEHEWTYKQRDPAPRYDAREAAAKLCELTGAVLILGSATPDVVSYQRALWGRYELVELRERIRPVYSGPNIVAISSTTDMPPVDVVDMREELKGGNRSIFSRSLQLGLYQTLAKGEQAILFLNRRGTAGFVQCRDCGFVPQCSACAIALSYHRHFDAGGVEVERLLCHQCNRGRRAFDRCPMCGGARLKPMGLGVEGVEEGLHELLPEARSLRWDRDVTHGRNAHELILARFLEGEADVLVGTQMVAKGLDLPAVTLVGVISADIGLHIPDFRSAERTFQLLTQVAGRAGRATANDGGPPPGRVVIQTYTPDNYAIEAAAQHDYALFFATEIELRRREAYPPFVRLARLVYSHSNPDTAERAAERMVRSLREDVSKRGLPGVEVLGPSPPHIPKWHGRYRWQITVRSPDPVELLGGLSLPEGWTLEIDPVSLA